MWHSNGKGPFHRTKGETDTEGERVSVNEVTTEQDEPRSSIKLPKTPPNTDEPGIIQEAPPIYGWKFWIRQWEQLVFSLQWLLEQMVPSDDPGSTILLLNMLSVLEYTKNWLVVLFDYLKQHPLIMAIFVLSPFPVILPFLLYLVLMLGYTSIGIITFSVIFTVSFLVITLFFTPLIIVGSVVMFISTLMVLGGYIMSVSVYPHVRWLFVWVADQVPPSVGVAEVPPSKPAPVPTEPVAAAPISSETITES